MTQFALFKLPGGLALSWWKGGLNHSSKTYTDAHGSWRKDGDLLLPGIPAALFPIDLQNENVSVVAER